MGNLTPPCVGVPSWRLRSSAMGRTAIGILMASHRSTSDHAFAMLRGASQHLNRKLRDVAEDVALTGELTADPTG